MYSSKVHASSPAWTAQTQHVGFLLALAAVHRRGRLVTTCERSERGRQVYYVNKHCLRRYLSKNFRYPRWRRLKWIFQCNIEDLIFTKFAKFAWRQHEKMSICFIIMELFVVWVVKPFLGDMYEVKIIWRHLNAKLGDVVTSQDLEQAVKNAGKE